jgi:hypothetical protein
MSTKIALLDALGLTQRKRIGFLELDCVMAETINMANGVTSAPIETGESVTDHMFNEPLQLTMDVIISDDDPTRFLEQFTSPILGLLENGVQGFQQGLQPQISARLEAYETLRDLWRNKGVVDVVTGFETFSNMAITNIDIPRDNEDGRSIKFTVNMIQITILPSTFTSEQGGFINTGRQQGTIANNSIEAIGTRILNRLPKLASVVGA